MAKKKPLDFESSLEELESLVGHLEQGDVSLETSLKYFERGIELTRNCQQALKKAEQKVQLLVEKDGMVDLQPFDSDE